MTINQTITIKGNSKHGCNKISEQGNEWKIMHVSQSVQFSTEPGPWLLIEHDHFTRWIHANHDHNFSIIH